ncbi:hypothetical protein ACS0TY_026596 [Phlomoides rotata]
MGFGVRKSTGIFSRDGKNILLSKLCVCSCNGIKIRKNGILPETRKVKQKSGVTRTNCKTQMRARLTEDGKYEVAKHIVQPNHTLTRKEWNHLHRSERAIREGKLFIRTTNSYRYLAHSAGGEDQVGHTMKDHMNIVNHEKMKNI